LRILKEQWEKPVLRREDQLLLRFLEDGSASCNENGQDSLFRAQNLPVECFSRRKISA
jgi:hypothetical protein